MIRRPRVWRHMWLASSAPPMTLESLRWTADNDNATPVKTLSLDVEQWLVRQKRAK